MDWQIIWDKSINHFQLDYDLVYLIFPNISLSLDDWKDKVDKNKGNLYRIIIIISNLVFKDYQYIGYEIILHRTLYRTIII